MSRRRNTVHIPRTRIHSRRRRHRKKHSRFKQWYHKVRWVFLPGLAHAVFRG